MERGKTKPGIYALTGYVKLFFIPLGSQVFNFPPVLQNMRLPLRKPEETWKKFRARASRHALLKFSPPLPSPVINKKRDYAKLLVKKRVKMAKIIQTNPSFSLWFFLAQFSATFHPRSISLSFSLSLLHFWSFRRGVYSSHARFISIHSSDVVITRAPDDFNTSSSSSFPSSPLV